MKALVPVHRNLKGDVIGENIQEVYDIAAQVARMRRCLKKVASKK
jgi:hypothetical protein